MSCHRCPRVHLFIYQHAHLFRQSQLVPFLAVLANISRFTINGQRMHV